MNVLSDFTFSDLGVRYFSDATTGGVGLQLHPLSLTDQLARKRRGLPSPPEVEREAEESSSPANALDSLVQVKLLGDPAPGAFASGHTMRQSASVRRFRLEGQKEETLDGKTRILTTLRSEEGLVLEHVLTHRHGDRALEVQTRFINGSAAPVKLEMLSSFSLSGITPFHPADAPGRLRVHRFRSIWSAEGRLDTRSIEELHLERSWSGSGMASERFGQVGSMPVRKWFPLAAIEDTAAGVVWGAQLAWAGSWQMEIFRQHDDVCLSGGLADREFGHWMKTLLPGEFLEAPVALISCVHGSFDDLCDRLTEVQHHAADTHPDIEADLPILFNEWCTTWGDPQHDKVLAIADRLQGTPTRFLVIDAGWYKTDEASWYISHGDWNPNAGLFPDGLEATAAAIRARGFVPGLWFEMETCGESSTAFSLVDHLLHRDGLPLTSNTRRFWDLNDPWVIDYLSEKVIGTLERGGFGYLKVDYNETIGLGSDHPDSLGEGLRLQTLGTYRFFQKIRVRLPHLVIENCSSGGHRLEPSMLGLTAMSSFSDAHEAVEIPIVAAALHRLMLPRQSQIWAVLRPADTDRRLTYSLAATFLGRMCLSGDVTSLSEDQWALVAEAQALYVEAAAVIKHGISRSYGALGESWRHPEGWQAIRRISRDGKRILVVLHAFAHAPVSAAIPLPEGEWEIRGRLTESETVVMDEILLVQGLHSFQGVVVLLDRV